jgi:hypothetical protein
VEDPLIFTFQAWFARSALKQIAKKLSPETKYPEKELNAVIATYHPDAAAIRRHMIEYGILERDGGSVYWVKEG